MEIYYSVNQKSLTYIKSGDKFEAAAKINISVIDKSLNKTLFSKLFKTPSATNDTSSGYLNQKLVGQVNFILEDGNYLLEITGSDFYDSVKKDIMTENFIVENYSDSKLKISDIELSDKIQKSDNENSLFYKNTLEVIPNPSGLFGMNLKELNYYYEVYGLTPDNISEEYVINYSVMNLNNESVISFNKNFKRNSESKADFGKIIIDSLERGSYILKISILDSVKNINVSREKKFYIFNDLLTGKVSKQDNFLKSEYITATEEDIDKEFEYAKYLMSEKEIDNYEKLSKLSDKKKFMYAFWKAKDVNTSTLVVEDKIDYFKRVAEANLNYKEAYREGWKTDRGRIFIIYGRPNDVERYPFEQGSKSYEVWSYNTAKGNGECVFIERQSSSGVYYLVHSTFKNEISNNNWKDDLK
ncbi:MAG TPA: GWxTD domain-containing protein [Ignavibacteria bacterium]|nr:GWxTD domain-containing protein [Ignavibacteria bacterium]